MDRLWKVVKHIPIATAIVAAGITASIALAMLMSVYPVQVLVAVAVIVMLVLAGMLSD